MNYLFYGGARSTGKTESITKFCDYLISRKGYTVKSGTFPPTVTKKDFECILVKKNKEILIQSYTDNVKIIKGLIKLKTSNPHITDIVTAIRNENDPMRKRLLNELKTNSSDYVFEIPLGKVVKGTTRTNNIIWYQERILNIAKEISTLSPFNF